MTDSSTSATVCSSLIKENFLCGVVEGIVVVLPNVLEFKTKRVLQPTRLLRQTMEFRTTQRFVCQVSLSAS